MIDDFGILEAIQRNMLPDAADSEGAKLLQQAIEVYQDEGLQPKKSKTFTGQKEFEALGAVVSGDIGLVSPKTALMKACT